MRTFAQVQPTFWTRGSGKALRDKPLARLLALYLMTGPPSTMIGLYYVTRRTMLDDTGIPDAELDACLKAVADVGIALYDAKEDLVLVPEGARYQIGPILTTGDRKRGSILKQLGLYGNHPFVLQWVARYYDPYSLANEGLARPHQAPLHTPSTTQNTPSDGAAAAPFSVLDLDLFSPRGGVGERGSEAPLVGDLETRAKLWVKDPNKAQLQYPAPHRWTEMTELNQLVGQVFGFEAPVLRTSSDRSVQNVLARWAEGHPQASMRLAVRGSAQAAVVRDKPENQTLATIFTNSSCVDKYARLAKGKQAPAVSKSNVEKLTPEAKAARASFRNNRDL